MKKTINILFFIIILFSLASCEIEDSSVESFSFAVNAKDWEWNPTYGRYEVFYDFPELTKRVYENGVVVGAIFVNEGSVETQTSLPYSQTYVSPTGTYVETISFDTAMGRMPTICFYIQRSDKLGTRPNTTRNFKITLIGRR